MVLHAFRNAGSSALKAACCSTLMAVGRISIFLSIAAGHRRSRRELCPLRAPIGTHGLALGNGLCYFAPIKENWTPDVAMVVTFVRSFPPDPETDLKNFHPKQAEYEAAYRHTGEPRVLYEALLHAQAAQQLTPNWLVDAIGKLNMPFALYKPLLNAQTARQLTPDWLVDAIGELIMRNRTRDTAERFKERMRHVQRYRCVRDLRQKRPNKDGVLECFTKDQALKLATAKLNTAGDAATQRTIEDSYDRVNRDLKRKGRESEFFWLVARSDPTIVPVCVSRTQSSEVIINGVAQRSRGA